MTSLHKTSRAFFILSHFLLLEQDCALSSRTQPHNTSRWTALITLRTSRRCQRQQQRCSKIRTNRSAAPEHHTQSSSFVKYKSSHKIQREAKSRRIGRWMLRHHLRTILIRLVQLLLLLQIHQSYPLVITPSSIIMASGFRTRISSNCNPFGKVPANGENNFAFKVYYAGA